MFHLRQTPVPPSNIEVVQTSIPTLKYKTETVYIATPLPKLHTEVVYIPVPPSKQQVPSVPPPVLSTKCQTKTVPGSIPSQKYKTTAASTSVSPSVFQSSAVPRSIPVLSSPPISTNVSLSKNRTAAAPAHGFSPVVYANRNKNSDYRYRNEVATTIPMKCPCICKVLAGLIIGLMLVAAIIIPFIIVLAQSTTTTTTTSTTTDTTTSATTETTTTTETTVTTTFTSSTASTSTSTTATTSTSSTSATTSISITTTATITTETTSSTSTSTTSSTSTSTTSTSTSTTSTTETTSSASTSTTSTSTSTTSTTSTATTTTATVNLTASEVQKNFDPSSLPLGWILCYNDTYDVILNLSLLQSILTQCNRGKLLLGCGPINSTVLTIAAMGLRSDVLYDCSNATSCTNVANGVGWYYSSDYSWGFVQGSDTVHRSNCDTDVNTLGATNPDLRLCWHTSPTYGGYRCGTNIGLNSNQNFVRVIYHVD